MPQPPNSHSILILRLAVGALFLLMLAGCWRRPEPPRRFVPGEPLYEQFTTQGRRVVLHDSQGPLMKMRQRPGSTRVYDHHMISVGRVRSTEDRQVELHSFDGQPRLRSQKISADVAELPGHWRLERADQGWDVFDGQGSLLALWRHDEDRGWSMRLSYGDATYYFVPSPAPHPNSQTSSHNQTSSRKKKVVGSDDRILLQSSAPWSDVKLLALSLSSLDPLARYALAQWADHHLARQPQSFSEPDTPQK